MPVGEDECPPAISEPGVQAEDRGAVEGGREGWEHQERDGAGRRCSRRKRKLNPSVVRLTEHEIRPPQQDYSGNEMNYEANPTHQLLQDEQDASTKRQCVGDYHAMLPTEEQYHGYEVVSGEGADRICDVPENHVLTDTLPPGEEGEEEDVECVMRKQQAEINDLLAKCREALSEGLEYEAFFPVRIDEMLKATQNLEQSLLQQKQAMKERLQAILGLL